MEKYSVNGILFLSCGLPLIRGADKLSGTKSISFSTPDPGGPVRCKFTRLAANFLGDRFGGALDGGQRGAGDVRRQCDAFRFQQLDVGRHRLDREGLERRAAQPARFQRLRERRVVDHRAARGVDEVRPRRHHRESRASLP